MDFREIERDNNVVLDCLNLVLLDSWIHSALL